MDSLQDWPEPVVRVQSLSDSGLTVIPHRYVKPPTERPSLTAGACGLNIPVIDLADGRAAAAGAVVDACREWGFFQVVNHGVSPELMRRERELWRGFFHLPMEEKQVFANSPRTYEGYGSRLGIDKGAILDWGDYYYLHLLPLCLKNQEKWPSLPLSLRETTEEYRRELVKLGGTVINMLSLGLGLEEGHLMRAFGGDDNIGACMRVNYYPKCPQPDLTLGLSSHSDPGGITMLLADDRVKGLQVRRGDTWVTVQPVPDAFIINVGDQIQAGGSILIYYFSPSLSRFAGRWTCRHRWILPSVTVKVPVLCLCALFVCLVLPALSHPLPLATCGRVVIINTVLCAPETAPVPCPL